MLALLVGVSACLIEEKRPEVLVTGAVKAGTTALFAALRDNKATTKEPHFFNDDAKFEQGLDLYASQLGCDAELSVDATPLYLIHPTALQRAVAAVPWATWIVLVREPVDRAFSHFNMLQRFAARTMCDATSFEQALEPELECYASSGFEACAATKVGGGLGRCLEPTGKLAQFGSLNGLLSHGVMAPQLRRAKSWGPRQLIVVSQRALYEDGEAVRDRILAAVGRQVGERGPVLRYESLSNHTNFGVHQDSSSFGGHRARIEVRSSIDKRLV